jgi:ATP-dependent exoDNAse (exonuclease V) beta subunit
VNPEKSFMLPITVIAAGAGSGKTFTLTHKLVELLQTGVRPEGIIATTFTRKAAAELQERVRIRLLEAGMTQQANEIGGALIGTVHSIGVQLLQRFSFEIGVSPLVEIIADRDGQRLFNESLAQVLTADRIQQLLEGSDRLGFHKSDFGSQRDIRSLIRDLTNIARANNFDAAVLEKSKIRSWESFTAFLPPASRVDTHAWFEQLDQELKEAIVRLRENTADTTKITLDGTEKLIGLRNSLEWKEKLFWYEIIAITKIKVGRKSADLLNPLIEFAHTHIQLPAFQEDIQHMISLVFDIAKDALVEYEQYKLSRGLIDYTDMESCVSRLLRIPRVRQTLEQEIDLLLVDEFQDTSPIQLDIFLQLSQIAGKCIWVGDAKQSIYGFRGAEPSLMRAVIDATGGIKPENILQQSWRSRTDLVFLSNALFTRAFHSIPEEQVVLKPTFTYEKEHVLGEKSNGGNPYPKAIQLWHLLNEEEPTKTPADPWTYQAIAGQINKSLQQQIPVFHKNRQSSTPLMPGDIAVLCRNNSHCQMMAKALNAIGIPTANSQTGLVATPEIQFTLACLRYLLTPADNLSAAEIVRFTRAKNLPELVASRLQYLDQQAQKPRTAGDSTVDFWLQDDPCLQQIFHLRIHSTDLSASEILERLIQELDLRRMVARLSNPRHRLANLDRLRYYARTYETDCSRLHEAASLGGFLRWINQLFEQGLDEQGAGNGPGAVNVLTYHRSKGLEFPMVICANLDQPSKENIWNINLVAEHETPDLDNILGGRWIRCWINPYSNQIRGTRLNQLVAESEAARSATETARQEEVRLLYVGLTRARDYLVFPTTTKSTRWLNRVTQNGEEEIPTFDPYQTETAYGWEGEILHSHNEVVYFKSDSTEMGIEPPPFPFHPAPAGRNQQAGRPFLLDVSKELLHPYRVEAGKIFAPPIVAAAAHQSAIGAAVARCLSAVRPGMAYDLLLEIAQHQLELGGISNLIQPVAVVSQMESFAHFFFAQTLPPSIVADFPVVRFVENQKAAFTVDLSWMAADTRHYLQIASHLEADKKNLPVRLIYPLSGCMTKGENQRFWVVSALDGLAFEILSDMK